MIRNALILIALIAACVGYAAFDAGFHHSRARVSDLEAAPTFSFQGLTGKDHALKDFEGKAVVLNFWASWCAPCVIEFPQMLRLAKATEKDSVFVFLSLDANDADIERFLKNQKEDVPQNVFIGRDPDGGISRQLFGTYKLPETYLITSRGMIAEKIIGADVVWDNAAMRRKIETLAIR